LSLDFRGVQDQGKYPFGLCHLASADGDVCTCFDFASVIIFKLFAPIMCTAARYSLSHLGFRPCLCGGVGLFVPLVYAHYVSAERSRLTNCCTRNCRRRRYTKIPTHKNGGAYIAPKDLRYIALYIDFLPGCKILEFNFQVNYRPSKMKRVHGAYAQYIVDQFTKETLAHLNYNRLKAFI